MKLLPSCDVCICNFDNDILKETFFSYASFLFASRADPSVLGDEEYIPEYGQAAVLDAMPHQLAVILARLAKFLGKTRESLVLKYVGVRDSASYAKNVKSMLLLQERFDAYWRELGIDTLICPASGLPATKHSETDIRIALSVNVHFNLLDYPAGVLPRVHTVTS